MARRDSTLRYLNKAPAQSGPAGFGVSYLNSIGSADPGVYTLEAGALHGKSAAAFRSRSESLRQQPSERAATAHPAPDPAQIEACLALHREGATERAMRGMAQLIAAFPHSALLLNIAGAMRLDNHEPEAALPFLRRAVALWEHFPEAHNNLGLALLRLGRLDAAVECFDEALRLNPDLAQTHSNLGLAYRGLNQLAVAARCCEKALAIAPDSAAAHEGLAQTLESMGDTVGAAANFQLAGDRFAVRGTLDASRRCRQQARRLTACQQASGTGTGGGTGTGSFD